MKFLSVLALLISFAFYSASAQETINWVTFEKAVELQKANPRPYFIYIYVDGVTWCKEMDANTFSNPVIAAYLNQNFYAVRLNGEQKEPITVNGHEFKFFQNEQGAWHELAFEFMEGNIKYPTIVCLDKDMGIVQSIPGFQNPESLEPIITYLNLGKYENTPWEDFLATFKSNL